VPETPADVVIAPPPPRVPLIPRRVLTSPGAAPPFRAGARADRTVLSLFGASTRERRPASQVARPCPLHPYRGVSICVNRRTVWCSEMAYSDGALHSLGLSLRPESVGSRPPETNGTPKSDRHHLLTLP